MGGHVGGYLHDSRGEKLLLHCIGLLYSYKGIPALVL